MRRILHSIFNVGLSAKMGLLVIVGVISMISLFAYLGTGALAESTQRNLQERVILAQMTASYMDALLENTESVLNYVASEPYWAEAVQFDSAMDQAYRRLSFAASRIIVVDNNANALAVKPVVLQPVSLADFPPVMAALNGTPFAVSRVVQSHPILGSVLLAAAPIRNGSGKITRALVIVLKIDATNNRAFAHPIGLGQSGYLDLIATDGLILASTRPTRVGQQSDHEDSLTSMIRDHRQAVSACHDCHTPLATSAPLAEVLAFAPLDRVPWGITIRQSESEVFASTQLLQTRIFGLMAVMLMGALSLVYLTTRSVIVPVQELTEATRRIAAGDLDSPLQEYGHDEVGVLARSFDEMREQLKESAEEIHALNRELDARVQERTAQYQAAAEENARLYAELARKEQLRGELLHRVIYAQEDERKRIARELHDETSQSLSALMVGFDTAQIAMAQDTQKAGAHLRNSKAVAESLLKNIHRLISDLRPSLLDDLGLVPAIAWYGEQRLNALGIAFQLNERGMNARLDPSMETSFFRIVQEAITNISRHAQATEVSVNLEHQGNYITLQICDNGRGFDPQILQRTDALGQGLGLRGMQERASILGGEFDLQTAPGKGTIITIRVHLPDGEAVHVQDPSVDG